MLLCRVEDPGRLEAIRKVYDTIAANEAPLAYAFVQQIPDGMGTWDIFVAAPKRQIDAILLLPLAHRDFVGN